MSYQSHPLNSTLRHPSMGSSQASSGQSPMLVARINEKKTELENLRQLRDLSGGLAAQMQALEEKLSTLSDGTEAVATILSNWHNVLRAINMASMKIPRPSTGDQDSKGADESATKVHLPQTLVRIPIEPQPESMEHQDSTSKQSAG